MELTFSLAIDSDAAELATLHSAAAGDLTQRFGRGFWSSSQSEKGVLRELSRPKFSRILIGRMGGQIAGTVRLATKKPWAIDTAYFTPVARPLYLTGMAVHPAFQRRGVGRLFMKEAEALARGWPGNAIRLDAFDAAPGAGDFYLKCGMREVAHVVYKGNPLIYFERVLDAIL
jgi:GNAT superfamily N-acetyltransferase